MANWKQLVSEFHTDNLVQTFIREVSIGNLIYQQSCFAVNQNRIRIYCRDITGRKQVELALQASGQNFRNSLDSSSIGIRISDKDDQTSYANKAMLDIFGYLNADKVRKSPPWKHYTQSLMPVMFNAMRNFCAVSRCRTMLKLTLNVRITRSSI